MSRAVQAVVIAMPIRNEAALLARSLHALRQAVDRLQATRNPPELAVTLALDSCDDGSAELAEASGFDCVHIAANNVGSARAAAIDRAIDHLGRPELGRVWIANTDADSTVPPNWLTHQVALAATGVDLMIGTVRPDLAELDPARRDAWMATHVLGEANGHVHGANLGIRASTYRAAGGFAPVREHEDVTLVAGARAVGAREIATDECWVLTSGRTEGRTPGGYARYLREDLSSLAESTEIDLRLRGKVDLRRLKHSGREYDGAQ